MPKKIKHESFKYRFLIAAHAVCSHVSGPARQEWGAWFAGLDFTYIDGATLVSWTHPVPNTCSFLLAEPRFYVRGDSRQNIERQVEFHQLNDEDAAKLANAAYFLDAVKAVAQSAGLQL